ncbi:MULTISPECIES: PspC domain-containing protein [Limosilactobacillus]|uniref:PspC domain-containing protein n=1 Tax=Limosilactobacillus TaxID=2742598 RepID=UPI002263C5CD|nr:MULTISPECIES: PspC domain-containing protein [Limosilactobacillus]MCH3921391.1 PspC domain-containing protein [Limosilactobacillus sp.]MCH3928162.1 PspC domain-containing protein [Limosilactobacillus sp.]
MKKRLTKSKNKVFLGVCGGLAEYMHVDPTVIRLVALVLLVLTGFFPVGLIYIVAALIMPDAGSHDDHVVEGEFEEKK